MSQSATAHKWLRDGSQGCASARGSRAACWPTCSSPWISLGSKTVFSGCRVCAHIPRVMKRFPGRSSMRWHRTAPRPRPGAAGGTTAYGVSCGRPRSACADPPGRGLLDRPLQASAPFPHPASSQAHPEPPSAMHHGHIEHRCPLQPAFSPPFEAREVNVLEQGPGGAWEMLEHPGSRNRASSFLSCFQTFLCPPGTLAVDAKYCGNLVYALAPYSGECAFSKSRCSGLFVFK